MSLRVALEPKQHTRRLALLERKHGHPEAKDELLLAVLAALAAVECTRVQNEPPYQVVIYALRCRATRFLEVHHREPRRLGGQSSPANLITLCGLQRLLDEGGETPAEGLPNTG